MIVLMRHGATEGGKGRYIGRTNLPLSAVGSAQAKELAEILSSIPFVELYSSPAERALDTIAPLAQRLELTVNVSARLDEINMGDWEGMPMDQIKADFPEEFWLRGQHFDSFRPPNGENFNDVATRAHYEICRLLNDESPKLVMCHAGIIRSMLCIVSEIPLSKLFDFHPQHCQGTIIARENDKMRLVNYNQTAQELAQYLQKHIF